MIKVSDFGLTEDMYAANYHKRKSDDTLEEKVPIRWMAPESIRNDIYTQKTDVVRDIASTEAMLQVVMFWSVSCFLNSGPLE